MQPELQHEQWSSRLTFIFAAVGSAVGLGNIWKFPYMAGVSGGGAFVLVYFFCAALVALPIMMAELLIGRRGRLSPPRSMERLAADGAHSRHWKKVGWIGVLAAFLILSFYSVIGGWATAYVPKFVAGTFRGADAAAVGAEFDAMLADPVTLFIWHTIFMIATVWFVARGISGGIEKAVNFMMPSLFILLVALVIYAAVEGDFAKGAWFLFHFDFSKITPAVVLAAMGQAFFSASVGLGTMMTYGAYLPRSVHIPRAAGTIVVADAFVALLAGLAIFPIVFANGLDAGSGPGLVFVTLPLAFGAMPGGMLFGALFFILIVFAALTSSISLLEPVTSYAEERGGIPRRVLAVVIGIVIWALGLFTVFSFNLWADVHPLGMIERFREATFFDLIDYATSNIFLPLGGFFIAIFAAWILDRATSQGELDLDDRWYGVWRFIARYVSPVAVAAIFIYNLS